MSNIKMNILCFLTVICFTFAEPTTFFKEDFKDGWESRWVESTHNGNETGKFVLSAGKFYGDSEKDKGIQTSQDAKFYELSASFDKFSNEGIELVIQFTVKHEQNIGCGGGFVKVFPSGLDQTDMHGESLFNIMFGPEICAPFMKKVHVIFNYKGKYLHVKKNIRCKDDVFTHLYTLIVRPDKTYEVKIDNKKIEAGELEDDWDFLAPKKIKDPEAKKPEDWDDRERIDDPDDSKPDYWDTPEHIDPDAKNSDDWGDEIDEEWEAEYKGEWNPKQIYNPVYKGKWIHPEIDNPEYVTDPNLYRYDDIGVIGFDLWQLKSGTIFDNILITDDENYAEEVGEKTWGVTKDAEKKMKDEQDEIEKKEREAEEAKRKEEEELKINQKKGDKVDEDSGEDKKEDAEKLSDEL